jgi:hypothetical protein
MDFDPVIIRLARHDPYRDFSHPFECKPMRMIIIVFDASSEESMPLLDFSNRILQHLFRDISFDAGYHSYDRKRRMRKKALNRGHFPFKVFVILLFRHL